ncbi:MAG TPA: DNA primase [Selenomonadales bacterium]|nr:DNA primase [Selenomonadales bacterium]
MKDAAYDEFIDKLRSESDIVNVISEYVPLKKKGRNYWGCCPFHNEKSPSFSVTPDKGFFYCFGCQAGGNVFNFLMKAENITFFEAVKLLAKKLDIALPEREKTERERQVERERANLFRANLLARDFFHSCLTKTGYGKAAREYLAARGIDDKLVAEYKLGYAPSSWDKLSAALLERGFEQEVLIKAGLVAARQSGGGVYDRFRDRIMFPIADLRGRIVGFGGRVLDGSQPKYLNTQETPLFNKRHVLYGFDLAYAAIRQSGKAIVVEGYMDLIAVQASGIKNAVASLGTAFTPDQARQLARHAGEIYFAYDSDAAGQNATLRALATIRTLGLKVRVLTLPDGKDPDEFIRKHGAEAFQALTEEAPALLDYQVRRALEESDHSSLEGKVAVVGKVVPALAEADNAVEVDAHVARLSQVLAIDESALRAEIRKYLTTAQKDKIVNRGKNISVAGLAQQPTSATVLAEKHIIRLMFEDNSIIPYVEAQLETQDVQSSERKVIINSLLSAYNMGKSLVPDLLASSLPEAAAAELSNIMVMDIQLNDLARMVDDCLRTIRLARLKALREQHQLKAHELERMGDSSYRQELAESQRIQDEINKLYQS